MILLCWWTNYLSYIPGKDHQNSYAEETHATGAGYTSVLGQTGYRGASQQQG